MSTKYWDLEEVERGSLTDDQMNMVTAHALMEAGLLNPEPPVMLPEEAPELPKETLYRLRQEGRYGNSLAIAFRTPQEAEACIKLRPITIDQQWVGHSHQEVIKGDQSLTFEAVQVVPEAAMNARKAEVERYNANKTANVQAQDTYKKARDKADSALTSIWEDQRRCQQLVHDIAKVRKTFDEYKYMCNDDERTARKFLAKTFSQELVTKALGEEAPECGDVAAPVTC